MNVVPVNDAPTIVGNGTTVSGSITEAAGITGLATHDTVTGVIAFNDVDIADTHVASSVLKSSTFSGGTLSPDQVAALSNAFSLGTLVDTTLTVRGGTQAWSFSVADSTFDFLVAGQTIIAVYTVTVDDGHGGTVAEDVKVTVTGSNDPPVLATPTVANYTDTSANDTFTASSGTLAGSDGDSGQTLSYGISGVTASGGSSTKVGSYGTLVVTTSTGVYTFTPNATAINVLQAGSNPSDSVTVTVSDGTSTTTAT